MDTGDMGRCLLMVFGITKMREGEGDGASTRKELPTIQSVLERKKPFPHKMVTRGAVRGKALLVGGEVIDSGEMLNGRLPDSRTWGKAKLSA
jgi:hypothetical protein